MWCKVRRGGEYGHEYAKEFKSLNDLLKFMNEMRCVIELKRDSEDKDYIDKVKALHAKGEAYARSNTNEPLESRQAFDMQMVASKQQFYKCEYLLTINPTYE